MKAAYTKYSTVMIFLVLFILLSGCLTVKQNGKSASNSSQLSFLDGVIKKGSKERKIFEGAQSVLSGLRGVDYETERTIGETFAIKGFKRYGLPVQNSELQEYVNLVGTAVARNSLRPTIPYDFVVVDSSLKNAFSCPGGIIFISKGLLDILENEAQLANILAHEVSHVQHKHALKSIRRARFLQGVGEITAATMEGDKGDQFESMLGDLQTVLFDKGLDKGMEYEADKSGMEIAYRTGYDPSGMIEVLQSLKKRRSQSKEKGSWFSTHPPLPERIDRCRSTLSGFSNWQGLAHVRGRFRNSVN